MFFKKETRNGFYWNWSFIAEMICELRELDHKWVIRLAGSIKHQMREVVTSPFGIEKYDFKTGSKSYFKLVGDFIQNQNP